MKQHPAEQKLEHYLGHGQELAEEERKEISAHIEECHFCQERLEVLEAYLEELEEGIEAEPDARIQELAKKIFRKPEVKRLPPSKLLSDTYEGYVQTYRQSYPSRFLYYVQKRPVRSVTLVAASAILAFMLLFIQPWADQNPEYAEVENNVLFAYNSQGEVLWNMPANGIPEGASSEDVWSSSDKDYRFIQIMDIDGDGRNEVLTNGKDEAGGFAADTVYCFESDGQLRWKQSPPKPISFGELSYTEAGKWEVDEFFMVNSSGAKKPRLFTIAHSKLSFVGVLFEMEGKTGKIKQTYWHPGHFQSRTLFKIDEKLSLLLGATNNAYNRAALVMLDPADIQGHGPVVERLKPAGQKRARERVYITFEPSNLSEQFNSAEYNSVPEIVTTDEKRIAVRTGESLARLDVDQYQNVNVGIYYILNRDFSVREVYGNDTFLKLYPRLYEEGRIDEPLIEDYWQNLKDSVLYWDGQRFVREPTEVN